MPRTTVTKVTAPGNFAHVGAVLPMTGADVVNMNQCVASGEDLVIAHNTDASSQTVTITSAPDEHGRTKDIATESIAAGEYRVYGPFKDLGWRQTDGYLYFQASHSGVKFGVIALAGVN